MCKYINKAYTSQKLISNNDSINIFFRDFNTIFRIKAVNLYPQESKNK